MNYPAPAHNPICQCKDNPMAAFMCLTGHMTECHYPYRCNHAGCNHLARYDYSPQEVQELQDKARESIEQGLRSPYKLDAQGNIIVEQPFEGDLP